MDHCDVQCTVQCTDRRVFVAGLSSPVPPLGQLNKDVEEDDVFMQLELPLERDSGSGSGASSPPVSPPPRHPPRAPSPHARTTDSCAEGVGGAVPDTHHHISFPNLQRSRTVTGAPSRMRSARSPGLPAGDPGPLGDNIYEWLQTCRSEKVGLRPRISEEELGSLEKVREPGPQPEGVKLLDKDLVSLTYNIALPHGPAAADPRYVELAGEDSVFGDVYGSDAYVKFDILPVEPQYHYPNLETATKG